MKQLLILACLVFGVVILGQKAYHIVVPEHSEATTGISLQSDNDSDAGRRAQIRVRRGFLMWQEQENRPSD